MHSISNRGRKCSYNSVIFLTWCRKTYRLQLINPQNLRRLEMKTMHIHEKFWVTDIFQKKKNQTRTFQCNFILDCVPSCCKLYEGAFPWTSMCRILYIWIHIYTYIYKSDFKGSIAYPNSISLNILRNTCLSWALFLPFVSAVPS